MFTVRLDTGERVVGYECAHYVVERAREVVLHLYDHDPEPKNPKWPFTFKHRLEIPVGAVAHVMNGAGATVEKVQGLKSPLPGLAPVEEAVESVAAKEA